MSKCFILDSDVLMRAKNFDYAFDICPGFWDILERGFRYGCILGHSKVRNEIMAGNDELKEWITDLDQSFFEEETESEIIKYVEMCAWVEKKYLPPAARDFASTEKADSLLCAKAAVQGLTVVTQEVANPKRKNRVKIPDVCNAFDIEVIQTHDFVRQLKAQFHLSQNHEFDESLYRKTLFQ